MSVHNFKMSSLRPILTIFALAFLMKEATTLQQTNNLEGFECSDQLKECNENLNPIYQQPAELLRLWQNCRVTALQEKLRAAQLELQVTNCQLNNLKTNAAESSKQEPAGVEGLWLPLEENGDWPAGAMISSNDGKLSVSVETHIGRTSSNMTETVLPCRLDDNIDCWYIGNGDGLDKNKFEVLINNNYKWQWTNFLLPIPEKAIIGGYRKTSSGWELLYIGRAIHTEYKRRNFTKNHILQGMVEGRSRKLLHSAWGMIETKNYYQILVAGDHECFKPNKKDEIHPDPSATPSLYE